MTEMPVPPVPARPAAARAVDLRKIYGEGDAAVEALGGVSVDLAAGEFTAIMGPSGSGKSTLLHCLAGLDTPTSGQVFIGDVDLTQLNDKRLTELRRDKVGFVFQAFNLVPTLNARENITLPLDIAGTGRRRGVVRRGRRDDRDRATGSPTGRASSPAASSSGSPARERWSPGRRSCSPTSRPATSTRSRARSCWASSARRSRTTDRRS